MMKINKTHMKPIYALIIVLITSVMNVTAQTVEEQLIGAWSCSYQESLNKMSVESKTAYDKVPDVVKQRIAASHNGQTLVFGSDGSYQQIFPNGQIIQGIWTFNNNDNSIEISSQGNQNKQIITLLAPPVLIIKPHNLGMGKSIVQQWYYTKN